ncbi:MAG: hypothetical protein P1U68_13300 [Verrucomicrobiales bacterium]|nr:hypothetical protein [Verrucomicrobiales bacterium]
MKSLSSTHCKVAAALIALLTAITVLSTSRDRESPLLPFMPGLKDYTRQWWADGFPGNEGSNPWLRVFETGRFAFVLNTETLEVPHFGITSSAPGYAESARSQTSTWKELPAAEMALHLTVDGKDYRAISGGEWKRHSGPRLIESGRFFQRSDVTDLTFISEDGSDLNVEARLETLAWPDRLGLVLSARPGVIDFPAGERCFGKTGGGFGLTGANEFEIAHRREFDTDSFTLDFWAFIPPEYNDATRSSPWLVCKSLNENVDGNLGITLSRGKATARINVGGGKENQTSITSVRDFQINRWNHFAISYDGTDFTFYENGQLVGAQEIGEPRTLESSPLIFGRRGDGHGDGRHFIGAVDEIHVRRHALTPQQALAKFRGSDKNSPTLKPSAEWSFDSNGISAETRPQESWKEAALKITFRSGGETISNSRLIDEAGLWSTEWEDVGITIIPETMSRAGHSPVSVTAVDKSTGRDLPVEYDQLKSWHRVDIDRVEPVLPPGEGRGIENDSMERVRLTLSNPSEEPQSARLLFAKSAKGFRQRIGFPITGISAILRDSSGKPTGIPVQLSKNWHLSAEATIYSGIWFHGISQINLPPGSTLQLELSIVYGHWGGLPAVSHSQLSLIGWGANQRWDQSALGSWGETLCYEPDQIQGGATITDVRPLLVKGKKNGGEYAWTVNVGGGDFFRWFSPDGDREPHADMRATYHRQGPCLTEVTYTGQIANGINHSTTVSLGRSDDLVRGTYRIRLDVTRPADFSRFVIFQIGADTYSSTGEKIMTVGNESGVTREWETHWGSNTYRTTPLKLTGRIPWISLHESVSRLPPDEEGSWPNRGIVIRSWKARLGGKEAAPWAAEHGVKARGHDTSTMDILSPPDVTRLEAGDFIEATIEHLILPKFADDYYGPNAALRKALSKHGNSSQMVMREAIKNDRQLRINTGEFLSKYPAIKIKADKGAADFFLTGGLGFVPVTFRGLSSPDHWLLTINGIPLDQSTHGNDFWQTDFDAASQQWSLTFNLQSREGKEQHIQLKPSQP